MIQLSKVIAAAAFIAAASVSDAAERLSLADRVQRLEQGGGANPALVDALNRLDQLQNEVQMLRGMVEEQAYTIDRLKQQQKDQYLDLDARLQSGVVALPESNRKSKPATARSGNTGKAPVQNQSDFSYIRADETPEVDSIPNQPAKTVGLRETSQPQVAITQDPEAEKRDYEAAFADLKEGRYADSARQFQAFVQNYPESEYADNAQYWLGESYYVTRNYRIALDAFQTLFNRYPDSSKGADALLKIGYTYYELEEWELSKKALQQVIDKNPDSTVARLASNRLRALLARTSQ